MKHQVISMNMHSGYVNIDGTEPVRIKLPEGCIGILFVFESKKMARKYWGKNVPTKRVEPVEQKG